MNKNNEWLFYHNVGTAIEPKHLEELHALNEDISYCVTFKEFNAHELGGFVHSYFQVALINNDNERVAEATASMFGLMFDQPYNDSTYYYAFDTIDDSVAHMSHILRERILPEQGLRTANAVNVFAIEVEETQSNKKALEQLIMYAIEYVAELETLKPTKYWLFDFSTDMQEKSELDRQAHAIKTSDYWQTEDAHAIGVYSHFEDDGGMLVLRQYNEEIFSI